MATKNSNKSNGNKINGKATMYNVSRFDDDGYGIRNVKLPGGKKKNTERKK